MGVGGAAYPPAQPPQTTPKLYWTVREPYNASGENWDTHGWAEIDVSSPDAHGRWHLGPRSENRFHSMKTAGYILSIPTAWADSHVDGKYLASGFHRWNGAFGGQQGPTLYAYGPWSDGNPPAAEAELDTVALLYYPTGGGYFSRLLRRRRLRGGGVAGGWWSSCGDHRRQQGDG